MPEPVVVRGNGQTRSTQSFVHVMSRVWKRPGLTALEVAWRWYAGLPIVGCIVWWGVLHLATLNSAFVSLETVTAFKPLEASSTVASVLATLWTLAGRTLLWFAPLALLVWIAAGALGQNIVARKLDPSTQRAAGTLFFLRLLRVAGVLVTLTVWALIVRWGRAWAITSPVARGQEPSFLLFMAVAIVASLTLFVGWAILSSPLELAQAIATSRGNTFRSALHEAWQNRRLRGQVMEVGLVLCIVRIALLVLAMVFSACPLPFSAVETAVFLRNWWIGVALWYLLMSDYFHVVRLASASALLAADESVI